MPMRVNEGSRLFREYKRTPLETEVVNLKNRLSILEDLLYRSENEPKNATEDSKNN